MLRGAPESSIESISPKVIKTWYAVTVTVECDAARDVHMIVSQGQHNIIFESAYFFFLRKQKGRARFLTFPLPVPFVISTAFKEINIKSHRWDPSAWLL